MTQKPVRNILPPSLLVMLVAQDAGASRASKEDLRLREGTLLSVMISIIRMILRCCQGTHTRTLPLLLPICITFTRQMFLTGRNDRIGTSRVSFMRKQFPDHELRPRACRGWATV